MSFTQYKPEGVPKKTWYHLEMITNEKFDWVDTVTRNMKTVNSDTLPFPLISSFGSQPESSERPIKVHSDVEASIPWTQVMHRPPRSRFQSAQTRHEGGDKDMEYAGRDWVVEACINKSDC